MIFLLSEVGSEQFLGAFPAEYLVDIERMHIKLLMNDTQGVNNNLAHLWHHNWPFLTNFDFVPTWTLETAFKTW